MACEINWNEVNKIISGFLLIDMNLEIVLINTSRDINNQIITAQYITIYDLGPVL